MIPRQFESSTMPASNTKRMSVHTICNLSSKRRRTCWKRRWLPTWLWLCNMVPASQAQACLAAFPDLAPGWSGLKRACPRLACLPPAWVPPWRACGQHPPCLRRAWLLEWHHPVQGVHHIITKAAMGTSNQPNSIMQEDQHVSNFLSNS